jgi:hypothetical protein
MKLRCLRQFISYSTRRSSRWNFHTSSNIRFDENSLRSAIRSASRCSRKSVYEAIIPLHVHKETLGSWNERKIAPVR